MGSRALSLSKCHVCMRVRLYVRVCVLSGVFSKKKTVIKLADEWWGRLVRAPQQLLESTLALYWR